MYACLDAGTLELLKAIQNLSELHLEHPNYNVLSILSNWAEKFSSALGPFLSQWKPPSHVIFSLSNFGSTGLEQIS